MAKGRERYTSRMEESERALSLYRRRHKTPMLFYSIKDRLLRLTSMPSFIDAVIIAFAFVAALAALGFYPPITALLILVIIFAAAVYHPFLGLLTFALFIFPMLMYQVPAIAWVFMVGISLALIYGYMHYRMIALLALVVALGFSPLGYIFEIPALIFTTLIVGYKRSVVVTVVAVLSIVMLSGVSGLANSGYVVYDPSGAHNIVAHGPIGSFVTPQQTSFNDLQVGSALSAAVARFTSGIVVDNISTTMASLLSSLTWGPVWFVAEGVAFIIAIVIIDQMAVSSRSKYKGTIASIAGAIYPISYVAASFLSGAKPSIGLAFSGLVVSLAIIYVMELYNFKIVKALEVRKRDVRMKFGEAFENLEAGSTTETFDDIGNYDATKRELKQAVLMPIEQRGIAQAYNVKPTKGILFFGPPGTGKTMMMRALANEIKAVFFYAKATDMISAFPGESERMISSMFSTAKKNAPAVLFIDEIDSIATNRESGLTDDSRRHALSQMLVEMDGFQKASRVIVVGATNVPNVLDPAILRPGRFDKIVYMPLPDLEGRKRIFEKYINGLPISRDVDIDELAEKTERYSGADIKAMCEGVAQKMSNIATEQHRMLQIGQDDFLDAIKATKPSTTLSQIDEYNRFRIEFARSSYSEEEVEKEERILIDDVVGLDTAKKAMEQAIEVPLLHPELMKKYDVKNIKGVLMFGPPGTGKTMLMKAVINEMGGVTLFEMNGSEIADQGMERATATINELFNKARENSPSVVFIDEIDGLVRKREQASETSVQITSEVLKQIDGLKKEFRVVVVGATNRPDMLDPAMLRPGRFDKMVFVKPPTEEERAKLFRYYLKKAPADKGIDYEKLARLTKGFTGADISGICREAKSAAMDEAIKSGAERNVDMQMLESIAKRTRPSAPEGVVSQYLAFLAKYGER
ncbi:MAG: AAA family ATPase [Candidatus Micrarchaeota archaeon]|nr:AAA family ATPase [Candidatus Micrarchaeota archaeon]